MTACAGSNPGKIAAGMIAAVVLAAGQSRRMGRPKMTLPWGETTIVGQVVSVLAQAGLDEIVAVTGGARREVEAALEGLPARTVFNPRFDEDEMAFSLQTGLSALREPVEAALVVLGDQPQIETGVVQAVLSAYRRTRAPLVVPSYRMRRGHPWLVARSLWRAVLGMSAGETLRSLLNAYSGQIYYLEVDTPSVLKDLDTPADYRREKPPAPGTKK